MANLASSIDDQQERHFIGDLLSEEDVFGQPNSNRIDASTAAQLQSGGVLPGAGPIGPSPNQTFWPEPPPPYSPYTAVPPQWASLNRQPAGMLAPPVAGLYGQSPTATAVTRTDFYQTTFNAPGEWDPVTGAPLEPYISVGSPIPYSSHPGMQVLKPTMMPAGGSMSTMQHLYHNIYRHHHQSVVSNHHHFGGAPSVLAHGPAAVTSLPSGYHGVEQPPPMMMEALSPHRIIGKASRKQSASLFHYGDSAPTSPGVQSGGALPSGGKTYSDAASNKQRNAQPASVSSNAAPSSVRHTSSSSTGASFEGSNGTPVLGARKITSSQRNTSERHSSGDSILENVPVPSAKEKAVVGLNPVARTNVVLRKRSGENEFQKIIHKKKGGKGTKNEPVVTDEDGRSAGTQVLDASSRFDVLQSLGGQPVPAVDSSARVTRRSLSSGTQRDTARITKDLKSVVDAAVTPGGTEAGGRTAKDASDELFGGNDEDSSSAAVKATAASSQRSVGKKVLSGSRREQGEQNILETARVSVRKHRAVPRKRQSTTLDYFNFVLLAVLSLARRAAQWIIDLVVDISLQLNDLTVYGAVATYTSVTVRCQRCWYFLLEKLRLLWNNVCSLNPRKLWARDSSDQGVWGLSDNIQLPTTGEEAMERLLRCHGQDAFVVLGLRADCSDESIKRYYKRQAVLVHPDKNHSSGAEEAFKILSRAFEAIGTPEARLKYSLANLHKNPLHQEMEELWARLREKMNEARNTMHCDCGSKHTRVAVPTMRALEARYCRKCNVRHPAKHNDIWAETRFGGFWWVYYACLDGVVYDITQWATCPNNRLKHMKANSHAVQYRLISTTGPSGSKGDNPSKRSKKSHHSQQDSDEFDCMDGSYGGNADGGCGCSVGAGGMDGGGAASQQASYRPPERRALDADRPRRAGRRRKVR